MITLKNLLQEAPVDTYQQIGDFTKGASFQDKRDREVLANPNAVQKVKDFFKNTEVDFDFYFVNLSGRRRFAEKGKVAEKFIFSPYPSGLGLTPEQLKNGKINEDNITVFFVGNTAAGKVPMTAWTIAHRFGHVLQKEYAFNEYTQWLDEQFKELLKLYNITPDPGSFVETRPFVKAKAKLFNQIGTMRSARQGEIDRHFEFYYELLAQYLNSGKVMFNPLSRSIVKGTAAYGRKEMGYTNSVDEVNDILNDIARDLPYYADDALNNAVGNIFVM